MKLDWKNYEYKILEIDNNMYECQIDGVIGKGSTPDMAYKEAIRKCRMNIHISQQWHLCKMFSYL